MLDVLKSAAIAKSIQRDKQSIHRDEQRASTMANRKCKHVEEQNTRWIAQRQEIEEVAEEDLV